jgi:hypothetical protein
LIEVFRDVFRYMQQATCAMRQKTALLLTANIMSEWAVMSDAFRYFLAEVQGYRMDQIADQRPGTPNNPLSVGTACLAFPIDPFALVEAACRVESRRGPGFE